MNNENACLKISSSARRFKKKERFNLGKIFWYQKEVKIPYSEYLFLQNKKYVSRFSGRRGKKILIEFVYAILNRV